MIKLLSRVNLVDVNQKIDQPQYDYQNSSIGIVHIGIGAFHRAHQAVFTDDLLAKGYDKWKITAVSLRSANIRNSMAPQDNLYSVVSRDTHGDKVRIIGAIEQVLVAPENPQEVIDAIASPSTKVVTITVTEKGYCRDKTGQNVDFEHPDIAHDLVNINAPKSLLGFIFASCKARMLSNQKLTIISCDNLPSNGRITERVVNQFAEKVDMTVAAWIKQNISFCNSMVDRIVPATTEQDIHFVSQKIGLTDQATVITEPFKQWVIEDNFANDRPEWDKVGVLFVKNVEAFEDMKLRLLNGIHSTLAYIGFLKGHEYIHQAVMDEDCLVFVKALQAQLLTTLEDVPNIDLVSYAQTILSRFANDRVPYKTLQVAADGSQKLTQRIVKPLESVLVKQGDVDLFAFVLASWCRYLEGRDVQGMVFNIVDPLATNLNQLATEYRDNEHKQVESVLRESGICTDTLLNNEVLIGRIVANLKLIHQLGMERALKTVIV
ncbi:mannitol dehydrogenase family protein [Pseudomonadota bacterium]